MLVRAFFIVCLSGVLLLTVRALSSNTYLEMQFSQKFMQLHFENRKGGHFICVQVVEAGAMAKIQPIAYWEFKFVPTTFTLGLLVVVLLYFSCFMCSAYSVCRLNIPISYVVFVFSSFAQYA
jgi:hypothetical protein